MCLRISSAHLDLIELGWIRVSRLHVGVPVQVGTHMPGTGRIGHGETSPLTLKNQYTLQLCEVRCMQRHLLQKVGERLQKTMPHFARRTEHWHCMPQAIVLVACCDSRYGNIVVLANH